MNDIPNLNAGASRTGRCFRWLFSRRILRRLVVCLAGLITLIAIVYLVVDWRGQRAWAACKREMAARGEVWDLSTFIPAPIPDDQNIFKAPKMAEWFGDNRGLLTAPLDHPITNDFARHFFNINTAAQIVTPAAAAAYLAWSDQFQPDFDVIQEALKRPSARLEDNLSEPLLLMRVPNVATCSAVVKTLVQRAKCHLLVGQTGQAWRELTLLQSLRGLVEDQGKLITSEGAWMRRELTRHSLSIIAKGLELHAWQEPQLLALQQQLAESDVIALHTRALKCSRALILSSLENGDLHKAQLRSSGGFWVTLKQHPDVLVFSIAPRGVMYQALLRRAADFRKMINAFSPANAVWRPAEVSAACAWWKRAQEGAPFLLRTQTQINEAQIACALERYRLAHREYPESLDTLVPQFIERLPRDLINGEPLMYHRTEDGSFLLYSVGWNETDEGGKIVLANGSLENLTMGDWVWKNSLNPE